MLGGIIGWTIRGDSSGYISVRQVSRTYKFIKPLLFVKTPEKNALPEYRPLRESFTNLADRLKAENKVEDIAIYFRNLNTSQWVGVNVDQRFAPASMLKVITLIGILLEAESKPSFLSSTVTVPSADKLPQVEQVDYGPKDPVISNRTYTINELLSHLIIDSDNTADYVLRSILGEDKRSKIHDDLELPEPNSGTGYTAREYSYIFRTLYNATYLSHGLSEQVLNSLTKTNFTQGIVQGVPKDIVVSHKFGIRTIEDEEIYQELHDCGIVYYPDHPYFLCVMTRGKDLKELEGVLKTVSELAWQEFTKLY